MHKRPELQSEFSFPAILAGGLIGGLSHPFLDAIMHLDMHPLMPFSDRNPFLGLISVGDLYLACVLAAVFGVLGMAFWIILGTPDAG